MNIRRLLVTIRRSFSLRAGTDVEGTIAAIRTGISLQGVNLYLLLASAVLASIGLDTNSTAVIIGAMLISPLMSPILGVGLAVATIDRQLLGAALRNLAAAVGLSLTVSAGYFSVTPLGALTDELASRTVPTLLDVGIALFGGLAGIVAMSRMEKTNAIPGVAIATALMPPVCTAGFGLAQADAAVFFGAFYLFFLNAVFIALSTFAVSRALGFPAKGEADERTARRVRLAVAAFAMVVTVPSVLLLVRVVGQQRLDRNIQSFVRAEIDSPSRTTLSWNVRDREGASEIVVYLGGEPLDEAKLAGIEGALGNFGLDGYRLRIVESALSAGARRAMVGEAKSELEKRIDAVREAEAKAKQEAEAEAERLREELRRRMGSPEELEDLRREMAVVFPEIDEASYAPVLEPLNGVHPSEAPAGGSSARGSTEPSGPKRPEAEAGVQEMLEPARVVVVTFARGTSSRTRASERERLARWLEERLDVRPVLVFEDTRALSSRSRR